VNQWGWRESVDAARFLRDNGWLPPYYAGRLAEWLRASGAPKSHQPVINRLIRMEFGSIQGNRALVNWMQDVCPLREREEV